jgi:hypothetical protein
MDYETTILPKGTILFRGFDSTSTLTSDFAGILNEDKFCLRENFNVFFYPFPFVSDTVKPYKYMTIYVTTRDVKILNLILPSKFNHGQRTHNRGGIVSCDSINVGCNVVGFHYDPCINYTKVPYDVTGMLAISPIDARQLKLLRRIFEKWSNKYFATYKDSRGAVGVPEIVLHPRMDKTVRTEPISDFEPWYREHKGDFNYIYLHVMENNTSSIQALMDEFMSDDGLDLGDETPYHMKLNKKTGFFQIDELSNNQSELISPKLALIPTADMVFTRADIYDKSVPSFPADIQLIVPESIVKSKPTTVPASLTVYNKNTKAVQFRDGFVEMLSEFVNKKVHVKRTTIKGDNGGPTDIDRYLINSTPYIFKLTPAGKEIERRAYETNDEKFLPDAPADVTGHPINAEISAYEFTSQKDPDNPSIKGIVSDTPSIDMNNTLTQLAYTEGLLGGSRRPTLRRTTLRRRRLLKSR